MVKLNRAQYPAPEMLREKRDQLTARWKAIRKVKGDQDWATDQTRRWLHEALIRLTHGKCAYCESRSAPEIEHYVAKTVDEDQAFEWSNLFPVCHPCHQKKGSNDHHDTLLKPDRDDPEQFLHVGPHGHLEPKLDLDDRQRDRVSASLRMYDLNRGDLVSCRYDMHRLVRLLLDRDPTKQKIDYILDPRREFKLVVRQSRPDLATEDRRRFEEHPHS